MDDLPHSPYLVVPTLPSTMKELTDDASRLLSNLRETDFPGIARKIEDLLGSAREQVGELQTNQLTTRLSTAAESFGQFMKSPDLRAAVEHIELAAAQLQRLSSNIDARVPPLATNLSLTLAAASETTRDLRDFLALRNQLGEQTQALLEQLNQTARSIEDFADFLRRHPNALITGREGEGQVR